MPWPSPAPSSSHMLEATGLPLSARSSVGVTKRVAASVIATRTSAPARRRSVTTWHALKAATLPPTSTSTRRPSQVGGHCAAPSARGAIGLDDGQDLSGGSSGVVVHDLMIVRVLERQLRDRELVAGLEARRILGGAVDEALLEGLDARGQEEDVDGVLSEAAADLLRALDVDLDDRVLAGRDRRLHALERASLQLAVDGRPLEELVALDHRPEGRLVDEPVRHAVDLTGTRRPRGVRDAVGKRRIEREQLAEHGVLADAARAR